MLSRSSIQVLVGLVLFVPAVAQESVRVSDAVRIILNEYDREVGNNAPPATRREAADKRDRRLNELLDEASRDPKPQHGALAVICMHLRRYAEAAKHCESALRDPVNANKEEVHFVLVQALIADKHLQRAEERFALALQKFPASLEIPKLRNDFYRAYLQLQQHAKAVEHILAQLEVDWPAIPENPQNVGAYLRNVDLLLFALRQTDRQEQALAEVERLSARAVRGASQGVGAMAALRHGLLEKKVQLLAELRKLDEALELLQPLIDEAARHAAANPKLIPVSLQWFQLLQLQYTLLEQVGDSRTNAARELYLSAIEERWKANPEYLALGDAWLTSRSGVIRSMIRNGEFDAAQKLLDELQAKQRIVGENESLKPLVERYAATVRLLTNNLTGERRRAALVGQPMKSFAGATWLNGNPSDANDWQGKVILLDFWAVWCGPCIATFPHLREWHAEFSDQGLVIIGVTRRYEFDFDGVKNAPTHVTGLSPLQEDDATRRFLQHHQLKHLVAVMPDDQLAKEYRVTGIPQAVVIDRRGVIRTIRVGSGEANAAVLREAIKKYLAEPAEVSPEK